MCPSVGIAAFAVDFDPRTTLEVGVGPSVGYFNDLVHIGMGWNLSVDDHRRYYFISLDFLRASETFGTLFGGGPK